MSKEFVDKYIQDIPFELWSLDGFSSCAMLHDNEPAFEQVYDTFYSKLDVLENHPVEPEVRRKIKQLQSARKVSWNLKNLAYSRNDVMLET
ncbi:20178_t:CDS:1, partial [Racocetra fulgida]